MMQLRRGADLQTLTSRETPPSQKHVKDLIMVCHHLVSDLAVTGCIPAAGLGCEPVKQSK